MANETPPPPGRVRILIAEDSPTQATRLRHTLERSGYGVSVTSNGEQALAEARREKPALVISDVVMPRMDGYEFCRQLKSGAGLADIPVILVTTLSDPQDVVKAIECGAESFVVKPYDDGRLLARVELILLNHAIEQVHEPVTPVIVHFNGQRHTISAGRVQILNLLLSTYDAAIQRNRELTLTKDALRSANAALEATNKELEAFSYSVSHDLRAPLRAIAGFSQSLLEDCAPRLLEADRDLLHRLQASSLRMKQLIEDLLKLSRISRGELRRERVDLSALTELVAAELRSREPGRNVDIHVAPGLWAQGDPRLLRVAMENLLGNAWKFTAKTAQAHIEFGADAEAQGPTFFVRDNGAGFDMTYAEKLFGAFQRLHAASEFPGTGIGLATVQRVIHRHGGRIWAQGKTGAGATFSFTL